MKPRPANPTLLSAAISISIVLVGVSAAKAQDQNNPGLGADVAPPQRQDKDHIVLGLGADVGPAYQGGKAYRMLPFPVFDVKEGIFFANLKNGIGIAPVDNSVVTFGASLNYVIGYRAQDVPRGINKLSDAMGARVFATFRTYGFETTLGVTDIVTGGTKGLVGDANVSYPFRISPRISLVPMVTTTWANQKYNDRYFGVTGAESLESGLPKFSVGSGFKDVTGALTVVFRLTRHINLSATASVTNVLGDVSNSPLVIHKTQPAGFFSTSYRF